MSQFNFSLKIKNRKCNISSIPTRDTFDEIQHCNIAVVTVGTNQNVIIFSIKEPGSQSQGRRVCDVNFTMKKLYEENAKFKDFPTDFSMKTFFLHDRALHKMMPKHCAAFFAHLISYTCCFHFIMK